MWALVGGVVAVVLGIIGLVNWWSYFLKGLMAAVPILLVLGGIIAVSSGVSDIKDRIAEKREKAKEEKEEKPKEEKKEETVEEKKKEG